MTPHYSPIHTVENVLGALLLSLVWLVPNHQLPWSAFHHELVMAVTLGLIAVILAWQTRWRMPMSLFGAVLLALALVPWGQWLGGLIPKAGTAAISSAYVGAVGLAFLIGHAARVQQHRRLLDILFAALALGAALNVPVQWIQWLQWYSSELESLVLLLVPPINERQRPSGMILQPNQLATVQVWGLLGLAWFRHHRMLSVPLFVLLFGWVCLGIGLTQSRAGLLAMASVAILLAIFLKGETRKTIVVTWWASLGALLVWSLYFKEVSTWLGIVHGGESRLTAIDGARIDGWRAFGAAILERPWSGYGLTDGGAAYVAVAHSRPDIYIGERFGHAHNAILDVVLWFGVPLGLLLLAALGTWATKRLLELPRRPENVFAMAALCALGVHSMLELPHQFLYFIAPAGLLAGWLMPDRPAEVLQSLPRFTWAVVGTGTLLIAALISADYFPYQERYTEWRFEHGRVGKRPNIEVHAPRVLNQIHDELALYRLAIRPGMDVNELRWVSESAQTAFSPPGYYLAAKAHALAGEIEKARVWMMRYNATMGAEGVRVVKAIWARDQRTYPALAGVVWPDYGGRRSTFIVSPDDLDKSTPMPLPGTLSETSVGQ